MSRESRRAIVVRWLKFNFVGALGIGVQLTVLAALKSGFHLHYLWATAMAVETAVVHNFLWHERFTWNDRGLENGALLRFLKFNGTNGALSIVGNLALMKLFAGVLQIPYLAANGMAIAICSLANFLVSDRLVFEDRAPSGT
jgi:putative flippase GtrA